MNRRTFLELGATTAVMSQKAKSVSRPVIDSHIHLFDPRRPQGIPWPTKDDGVLYRAALPDRYKTEVKGLGVVGAIEVEASPWLEDNQWVLDLAAKDPMIVGTVGNLEPGKPGFRKHLDRFHKNSLFLGIRCGNLWGRNLTEQLNHPEFVADIQALAEAGLALDTANPSPLLISATLKLQDRVPELRIILDHLPQMEPPSNLAGRSAVRSELGELGQRPQIFAKLSQVLRKASGKVPGDLLFYRARLNELWDIFGEHRLLYGSDWPNSDLWAPYPSGFHLVEQFLAEKGFAAQEKVFCRNSQAAYRWLPRNQTQMQALAGESCL